MVEFDASETAIEAILGFRRERKEDRQECLSSTERREKPFYCAASTMMPMFFAPLVRAMSRNDIVVS